jgi:hypothetical protein
VKYNHENKRTFVAVEPLSSSRGSPIPQFRSIYLPPAMTWQHPRG